MKYNFYILPLIQGKGGGVGWCDGPGLASSAGASYNLDDSRARAYCACSRCGWGCLVIFTLLCLFSSLSPSLWETNRYRLKRCLKGPLNPKQATNQILFSVTFKLVPLLSTPCGTTGKDYCYDGCHWITY